MNNDFVKNLNIPNGIVVYNDFDIDENIPFQDQKYSFKQDILQIELSNHLFLDVGWYPKMNPEGHFWIRVIQDYDWQNPLYEEKCRTLEELKNIIEEFALLINNLESKQRK